jgi:hypothetical protein
VKPTAATTAIAHIEIHKTIKKISSVTGVFDDLFICHPLCKRLQNLCKEAAMTVF